MGAAMQKPPAKGPDKVARPYHSELRAKAAAQTRTTILATAMRLFLAHGYGKVTVNDIAQEANLAVPTVYASTGGKSAILSTLIDDAMRDPIVEETLSAIRTCRSPDEVISVTAHGTRVDNERYHDIAQVMATAAALDDAAGDILVRSDEGYREALSHAARRLKSLRALKRGLTDKQAVDILWFYFGREAWHLFVYDRHWSWDDAQSWLAAQAYTALARGSAAR
jgi:AcrR family transcriptional regulator